MNFVVLFVYFSDHTAPYFQIVQIGVCFFSTVIHTIAFTTLEYGLFNLDSRVTESQAALVTS